MQPGAAPEKKQGTLTTVNITVDSNGNIQVDKPVVTLSKSKNDQVEWVCEVDPKFDVDFYPASPFSRAHFDKNDRKSGDIPDKTPTGPYNYTVGLRGKKALDPRVIIDD